MAGRPLTERVKILEQQVERLRELPSRMAAVESQILQLRGEMQGGISAIRGDIDETRRHMRVLHEEVLSRIALLVDDHGPDKRRVGTGAPRRIPARGPCQSTRSLSGRELQPWTGRGKLDVQRLRDPDGDVGLDGQDVRHLHVINI